MKKYVYFICLLMAMALSCEKSSIVEEDVPASIELDGRTIFKAVFFNLGENTKDIPSLKNQYDYINAKALKNPNFIQGYEASINGFLDEIELRNPNYLNNLKNAIYSKNFSRIKKEMEFGTTLIAPIIILHTMNSIDDDNLKNDIAKIDISAVNFNDANELLALNKKLYSVIDQNSYIKDVAYSRIEQCIDIDVAVELDFALEFNFAADYNFAYNHEIAWNRNFAWSHNWHWEAVALGDQLKYDSFSGEKLVEEIAFAF